MSQRREHTRKQHDRVLHSGRIVHVKEANVRQSSLEMQTLSMSFADKMRFIADNVTNRDNVHIKRYIHDIDILIESKKETGFQFMEVGLRTRAPFPIEITNIDYAIKVLELYFRDKGYNTRTEDGKMMIYWGCEA